MHWTAVHGAAAKRSIISQGCTARGHSKIAQANTCLLAGISGKQEPPLSPYMSLQSSLHGAWLHGEMHRRATSVCTG